MIKFILDELVYDIYTNADGFTVQREFDTVADDGKKLWGQWVFRDPTGSIIDFDHFRHDMYERQGIKVNRMLDHEVMVRMKFD